MTLRSLIGIAACCTMATIFNPASARATTIHVGPGDQLSTALLSATAGDTVLVGCGIYDENNLHLPAEVTLRSETGDPACVTIATDGGHPILTIADGTISTMVEGITFTADVGGLTTPVARGAGLMIIQAAPRITNCSFQDLAAGYGGAVYCADGAAPIFQGCSFDGNRALAVGGALNCVGTATPIFDSCLFSDNVAESGGHAVHAALGARPYLVACTLADNGTGPALMAWDGATIGLNKCLVTGAPWLGDTSAVPTISCSDLFSEAGQAWSGLLAPQAGQKGNIAADPIFCGDLAGAGLYTLDANSPCTAAATNGCGRIGAFAVGCAVSGVDDGSGILPQTPPVATRLRGNYPNPFNPSTTIRYDLKVSGLAEIAIFDLAGRRVTELVNAQQDAGAHEILWRGTDARGRSVPAGVYFVQLRTADTRDTSRLSVIK